MIFFRADGNITVGTGHIMRCLSLADAFHEQGVDSVFLIAESYMQAFIEGRGYECLVLGTAYDHMEGELPILLPLLEEKRPRCVILDSYFVTPDYMRAVKAKAPLVYMDDLNTFDYPADIVVNYNIYGKAEAYPPDKTYFLGPQYAPLRKQFQGLAPRIPKKRVEQILFSTGGTDQYHAALRCVEYLRENPPRENILYHFVIGSMNQDIVQIKSKAAGLPYIQLDQHVTDICTLMLQCDAAVSAAGTTLYELCACGLPTVTYILADNQMKGASAFAEAGVMPCAGDMRTDPCFIKHVFSRLNELKDWKRRQETASKMQTLVDGNGARRLAEKICRQMKAGEAAG